MTSRGKEIVQTIRYPATANLMIDSTDGGYINGVMNPTASSGKFTITRPSNLQNGFFTRVAATEVVLNWSLPNISASVPGTITSTQAIDIATVGVVTFQIADGVYNCQQAIEAFITLVNASGNGITLTATSVGGNCVLTAVGNNFRFPAGAGFMTDIGFPTGGPYTNTLSAALTTVAAGFGVLQQYKYIDFVSPQLTYCQDVKDASTNIQVRDVLCRWYFAFDTDLPVTDGLGFPIYMGYVPFSVRRLYNPPKQINWNPSLPVGNLSFEVWATPLDPTQPAVLLDNNYFEWAMTLQLSEN